MRQGRVPAIAVVIASMALGGPALADPADNAAGAGGPKQVSTCNVSAASIEFPSSSVRLLIEAQMVLWDIAVWVRADPSRSIRLRGMTDGSGDARSDARLSDRQVDAVRTYLTQQGVDPGRITTIGHPGVPPEAAADNRPAVAVVTCLMAALTP